MVAHLGFENGRVPPDLTDSIFDQVLFTIAISADEGRVWPKTLHKFLIVIERLI
jgi:hypothetical protein